MDELDFSSRCLDLESLRYGFFLDGRGIAMAGSRVSALLACPQIHLCLFIPFIFILCGPNALSYALTHYNGDTWFQSKKGSSFLAFYCMK